ncbi:MAG: CPBP family intramembrane metalloprotease [Actinobacteria bacterium]|nr:CPBP family intramembrane metalloprotease [Actinomycetota bacterium]
MKSSVTPDAAIRPSRWRLVAWLVLVLALTALGYAGRLDGSEPPDDIAFRYAYALGALVQYGVMLGILLLIARGLPVREFFALRRPASWWKAAGLAAAALVAIWIVGAALAPFLDATEEQGLVPDEFDSSRVGAFVAFFVVVAFVAPVVEELTYRGLGFSLLAPYGVTVAILLTGVLFGLAHGLLIALPVLTFFGIAVGWLRARTHSIYPSIALHSLFNGTALILSVSGVGG